MRLTIEAGDMLGHDEDFQAWLRLHDIDPKLTRRVHIVCERQEHTVSAELCEMDDEGRLVRDPDDEHDLLTHEVRRPIKDGWTPVPAWGVAHYVTPGVGGNH